ncbi:MAG: glucosaminidase domain-containing protein [Bacteroidales bacterium]|nr:glucosaminidase domain-containing protein [Candidatus Scybalousia scybalohippi]
MDLGSLFYSVGVKLEGDSLRKLYEVEERLRTIPEKKSVSLDIQVAQGINDATTAVKQLNKTFEAAEYSATSLKNILNDVWGKNRTSSGAKTAVKEIANLGNVANEVDKMFSSVASKISENKVNLRNLLTGIFETDTTTSGLEKANANFANASKMMQRYVDEYKSIANVLEVLRSEAGLGKNSTELKTMLGSFGKGKGFGIDNLRNAAEEMQRFVDEYKKYQKEINSDVFVRTDPERAKALRDKMFSNTFFRDSLNSSDGKAAFEAYFDQIAANAIRTQEKIFTVFGKLGENAPASLKVAFDEMVKMMQVLGNNNIEQLHVDTVYIKKFSVATGALVNLRTQIQQYLDETKFNINGNIGDINSGKGRGSSSDKGSSNTRMDAKKKAEFIEDNLPLIERYEKNLGKSFKELDGFDKVVDINERYKIVKNVLEQAKAEWDKQMGSMADKAIEEAKALMKAAGEINRNKSLSPEEKYKQLYSAWSEVDKKLGIYSDRDDAKNILAAITSIKDISSSSLSNDRIKAIEAEVNASQKAKEQVVDDEKVKQLELKKTADAMKAAYEKTGFGSTIEQKVSAVREAIGDKGLLKEALDYFNKTLLFDAKAFEGYAKTEGNESQRIYLQKIAEDAQNAKTAIDLTLDALKKAKTDSDIADKTAGFVKAVVNAGNVIQRARNIEQVYTPSGAETIVQQTEQAKAIEGIGNAADQAAIKVQKMNEALNASVSKQSVDSYGLILSNPTNAFGLFSKDVVNGTSDRFLQTAIDEAENKLKAIREEFQIKKNSNTGTEFEEPFKKMIEQIGGAQSSLASFRRALALVEDPTELSGLAKKFENVAEKINLVISRSDKMATEFQNLHFARGIVGLAGPGTSTSDSISALLSVGESVITAKATNALHEYLNLFQALGDGTYNIKEAENALRKLFTLSGGSNNTFIDAIVELRRGAISEKTKSAIIEELNRSTADIMNSRPELQKKYVEMVRLMEQQRKVALGSLDNRKIYEGMVDTSKDRQELANLTTSIAATKTALYAHHDFPFFNSMEKRIERANAILNTLRFQIEDLESKKATSPSTFTAAEQARLNALNSRFNAVASYKIGKENSIMIGASAGIDEIHAYKQKIAMEESASRVISANIAQTEKENYAIKRRLDAIEDLKKELMMIERLYDSLKKRGEAFKDDGSRTVKANYLAKRGAEIEEKLRKATYTRTETTKDATKGVYSDVLNELKRKIRQYENGIKSVEKSGVRATGLRNVVSDLQKYQRELEKTKRTENKFALDSMLASHSKRISDIINKRKDSIKSDGNALLFARSWDKVSAAAGNASGIFERTLGSTRDRVLSVDNQFSQLGSTIENALSIVGLQQFAHQIITIGGELEKQKLAMGAIFSNESEALEIYNKVSTLSMISPFTVQDLVKNTKQLSAFGIGYNELYETTKRLSDISAAVGVDFSRIAYEFGQTSARGWLDARELRMFSNSGVPLLRKLSEFYSNKEGDIVSTSDVRKRISNREVSFEDVKSVLWEMTDETGEFYKMQEVMAESLAAKYANLENAFNLMLGRMAEGGSGNALKWLAEVLTSLTNNLGYLSVAISSYLVYAAAAKIANKQMTSVISAENVEIIKNEIATKKRNLAYLQLRKNTVGLTKEEQKLLATTKLTNASMVGDLVKSGKLTKEAAAYALAYTDLGRSLQGLSKREILNQINPIFGEKEDKGLRRMIVSFRKGSIVANRFKFAISSLGIAFVSLKNAIVSLLANPMTWIMVAVTAILEAAMYFKNKHEELEEKNRNFVNKGIDGIAKLHKAVEDVYKITNNGQTPFKDLTLSAQEAKETIDGLKETIREFDPIWKKTFNNAFAGIIDPTTGEMNFLSTNSQIEVLSKRVALLEELYKRIAESKTSYKHALEQTDGVFDEGVEKNAKDYQDYVGSLNELLSSKDKDAIFEGTNNLLAEMKTLYEGGVLKESFEGEFDKLISSVENSKNVQSKLYKLLTSSIFLDNSNALIGENSNLYKLFNIFDYKLRGKVDKIQYARKVLSADLDIFASEINKILSKEQLKEDSEEYEALANQYIEIFVSQAQVDDEIKELIRGDLRRKLNLVVSYEYNPGEEPANKIQKDILDSMSNLKPEDVESEYKKYYDKLERGVKSRKEETELAKYIEKEFKDAEDYLKKFTILDKDGNYTEHSRNADLQTEVDNRIKYIEYLRAAAAGLGIELDSKSKKDNKEVEKEITDTMNNLKKAYSEYKKFLSLYGPDAALSKWVQTDRYQREFSSLDIDDIIDYRNALERMYNEAADSGQKEVASKLSDLMIEFDFDVDGKSIEQEISKVKKSVDDEIEQWNFYDALISAGMDRDKARELALSGLTELVQNDSIRALRRQMAEEIKEIRLISGETADGIDNAIKTTMVPKTKTDYIKWTYNRIYEALKGKDFSSNLSDDDVKKFAGYMVMQTGIESTWGRSKLSYAYKNYGGIKLWPGRDKDAALKKQQSKFPNGIGWVEMNNKAGTDPAFYITFGNIDGYISDYLDYMNRKWEAFSGGSDVDSFIKQLFNNPKHPGQVYGTASHYAHTLRNAAKEIDAAIKNLDSSPVQFFEKKYTDSSYGLDVKRITDSIDTLLEMTEDVMRERFGDSADKVKSIVDKYKQKISEVLLSGELEGRISNSTLIDELRKRLKDLTGFSGNAEVLKYMDFEALQDYLKKNGAKSLGKVEAQEAVYIVDKISNLVDTERKSVEQSFLAAYSETESYFKKRTAIFAKANKEISIELKGKNKRQEIIDAISLKAERDAAALDLERWKSIMQNYSLDNIYSKEWISNMEKARELALAGNDKTLIDSINAKYDSQSKVTAFDNWKSNPMVDFIMNNLANSSAKVLSKMNDDLGSLVNKVKELPYEKYKEFVELSSKVFDEKSKNNPFSSIKKSLDDLNTARKEYDNSNWDSKINPLMDIVAKEQLAAEEANSKVAKYAAGLDVDQSKWTEEQQKAYKTLVTSSEEANNRVLKSNQELADAEEMRKKQILDIVTAEKRLLTAINEIKNSMQELGSSFSNLGSSLGGAWGDGFSLLGETFSAMSSYWDSISKITKGGFSAVTGYIQAFATTISLSKKLSDAVSDMNYKHYERDARKLQQINEMEQAVLAYNDAVAKANQNERNWFSGGTESSKIKDNIENARNAMFAYQATAAESQKIYQNKSGKGWGAYFVAGLATAAATVAAIYSGGTALTAAAGTIAAMWETAGASFTVATIAGAATVAAAGAAVGSGITAGANAIYNAISCASGQTAAINNLVIETKKRDKGFWGTGWGGNDQETQNLVQWLKDAGKIAEAYTSKMFGSISDSSYKSLVGSFKGSKLKKAFAEAAAKSGITNFNLFDEFGLLNVELAKSVLENETMSSKLQGQTKDTLEVLLKYTEQYEDAMNSIKESVSNWYSPLISAMSDGIWAWFDEGTTALYSFRKAASDTFRSIASDMVQYMLMNTIFDGLDDQLAKLTAAWSGGTNEGFSTEQYIGSVVDLLGNAAEKYEEFSPVLEGVIDGFEAKLNKYGMSLHTDSGSSITSSISGMTEETADILAAYLNGIRGDLSAQRYAVERIYELLLEEMAVREDSALYSPSTRANLAQELESLELLNPSENEILQSIGYEMLPQLSATATAQLNQLNQQTEYLRQLTSISQSIQYSVDEIHRDVHRASTGDAPLYVN